MRNSHRTVVSTLLIVALSLAGVTSARGAVAAEAPAVTLNEITYTQTSTQPASVTVTAYSGPGGPVEIRGTVTVNSIVMPVVAIGDWAFACYNPNNIPEPCYRGDHPVTSVVIPAGVTTIGTAAFSGNAMKAIDLPSSVTTIGIEAFAFNQLVSVTIPSSVTAIAYGAFQGNKLESVSLPTTIQTIGDFAFARNSLESVTIPTSVTSIGQDAFWWNKLSSVTIPATINALGVEAFDENPLTKVFMMGAAPTTTIYGTPLFGDDPALKIYIFPKHRQSYGVAEWNSYGVVDASSGVDFDPNGYGLKPVGQMWLDGSNVAVAPPGPTSPGQEFQGWYTAATGGGLWDFSSPVTGFITLFAQWGKTFEVVGVPTILGTAQVGSTLVADAGKWAPEPTLQYRWERGGSLIVGADKDTYVLSNDDLGQAITVTVSASALAYSATVRTSGPTAAVSARAFTTRPTPTVVGAPQVGRLLSVNPGVWEEEAAFVYAWRQVGSEDVLGTAPRYTPRSADRGKKLTVTITASLTGYTTAVIPSAPTTLIVPGVFALAPIPSISGVKQVGEPLTASPGTWTTGAVLTYAWKRSGSASIIASGARYIPVSADVGKTLTVTVTAMRDGFTTLTKTSVATTGILGSPFTIMPTPTITGTLRVGQTLIADTRGWTPTPTSFRYVWMRTTLAGKTTVIAGATKSTYKVVTADKSKFITVTVTAIKPLFLSTPRSSGAGEIFIPN